MQLPTAHQDPAAQPVASGALKTLAALLIVLEASLYSAVAPLLPSYERELDMSTSAAGVLTGSYTAGMLAAALASAAIISRIGVRATVTIGLALLAGASVVFGFANDLVVLDVSRAVQGIGSGLLWSGLLAWLIAAVPSAVRGRTIGAAMGAAVFGTLFGPILGVLAVATDPAVVFGTVGLVAAGAVFWVARMPGAPSVGVRTEWPLVLRSRRVVALAVLSVVPGVIAGVMNTLVPLRLSDGGFSDTAVGATFLVSAAIAAGLAPIWGRRSDRGLRVQLIVGGSSGLACGTLALAVLGAAWPTALVVSALGAAMTAFGVPLMAMFSEAAEQAGMAVGAIAAMINLGWSGGETIGAPLGALTADHTSDAVPFAVLALVMLVVSLTFARRGSAVQADLVASRS